VPGEISDVLSEIDRLTALPTEIENAEERLSSLIATIGDNELAVWGKDIRLTIDHFLPKRRRRLNAILDRRLSPRSGDQDDVGTSQNTTEIDVAQLTIGLRETLAELSQYHLFQWSTFYRDALFTYFQRFFEATNKAADPDQIAGQLRNALAEHSEEIFPKGFAYVRRSETLQYAVTKSLNGLQRFLDLPIEFYSTTLASVPARQHARLRLLVSSMIVGILDGYAAVKFDQQSGGQVLPRYPRSWAYALAFLTGSDLEQLLTWLEAGDFRDGTVNCVLPLVEALDDLGSIEHDYAPVPVLAQMVWEARRLEISLVPPPQSGELEPLEAQCYFDAAFVNKDRIDEAVRRGVSVVVAPLRPDLEQVVGRSERMSRVVVRGNDETGRSGARQLIIRSLNSAFHARRSPRKSSQPL
jgi:hypothetical protein